MIFFWQGYGITSEFNILLIVNIIGAKIITDAAAKKEMLFVPAIKPAMYCCKVVTGKFNAEKLFIFGQRINGHDIRCIIYKINNTNVFITYKVNYSLTFCDLFEIFIIDTPFLNLIITIAHIIGNYVSILIWVIETFFLIDLRSVWKIYYLFRAGYGIVIHITFTEAVPVSEICTALFRGLDV